MSRRHLPSMPVSRLLTKEYGAALAREIEKAQAQFKPRAKTMLAELSAGNPHPYVPRVTLTMNADRLASKFIGRGVTNTNKAFSTAVKGTTGLKITPSGSRIDNLTKRYIGDNVSLIKSIPDRLHSQVNDVIHEGLTKGRRPEAMAADIEERFNVAKSRAMFIARDQLSKLNGDLNRTNQEELGVVNYIWRTAGDEAVRDGADDNHRAMEGMLCSWADPTIYSPDDGESWLPRADIGGPDLEPGEDFNCRCTAEGVLPSLASLAAAQRSSGDASSTEEDFLFQSPESIAAVQNEIDYASLPVEYMPEVQAAVGSAVDMVSMSHVVESGLLKDAIADPIKPGVIAELKGSTLKINPAEFSGTAISHEERSLAVVHEIGHKVFNDIMARRPEALNHIVDVLTKSTHAQTLASRAAASRVANAGKAGAKELLDYHAYMIREKELFARAYTNFVVDGLPKEMAVYKQLNNRGVMHSRIYGNPGDAQGIMPVGWSAEDSTKLHAAFSMLFKQQGLLP